MWPSSSRKPSTARPGPLPSRRTPRRDNGATAEFRLGSGAFAKTPSYAGLGAGEYAITYRDTTRGICESGERTITLDPAERLIETIAAITDSLACSGDENARISVQGQGSNTFSYQLQGGSPRSSGVFSGLGSGVYIIETRVVGGSACAETDTITIVEPTLLLAEVTLSVNTTCGDNNGALTVSASGGAGAYSYTWSNGATTASITGLTAGDYTVTVTDANGCTATAAGSIEPSTAVGIEVISMTAATCGTADGALEVEAFGAVAPVSYRLGATGASQGSGISPALPPARTPSRPPGPTGARPRKRSPSRRPGARASRPQPSSSTRSSARATPRRASAST